MLSEDVPLTFTIFWFGCVWPLVIFDFFILIGLLVRWRIVFYLFLIGAVLRLGNTAVTLFQMSDLYGFSLPMVIYGGGLAFISIAQFFMALNLGEDFTFDKYRILTQVDPGLKTGINLLERGRRYAERKMWAKAAIHFRQAAYQMSESVEPQLSLAVAYINLKFYNLAAEPLAKARMLDPYNPKIDKLETLLTSSSQKV